MQWRASSLGLALVFFGLVLVYSGFASQGELPLLSPDETAVAALVPHVVQSGGLSIGEGRAVAIPWFHPRSFVAIDGRLLPIGFPLWTVLLGVVGWVGMGASLWLAVCVSASAIVPFVWLVEERVGITRGRAIVVALSALCLPMAVLYGNRSFFTLLPQLALAAWSFWLVQSEYRRTSCQWLAGYGWALAIGLRPVEAIWLIPWLLYAYTLKPSWSRALWMSHILGFVMGVASVLGIHAWVYGSPWTIGYWLSSGSSAAVPSTAPSVVSADSDWLVVARKLFPYGLSLHQLQRNVVTTAALGFWPWMLGWALGAMAVVRSYKTMLHTKERWMLFAIVSWMLVWLLFYYGQGLYADHAAGQFMHLGNSFLRYLAPAMMAWTAYIIGLALHRWQSGKAVFGIMAVVALGVVGGVVWAYTDSQDGILRGRRERLHYADVRAFVQAESPSSTVWVSDRSDKMVFPTRMAIAPLPTPAALAQLLRTNAGPVWVYIRPPSQRDRDVWVSEGLELVERKAYDREVIFEVRLRDARQSP